MYLKKGDTVKIIAGKDKGKEGIIETVLPNDKVIIENMNMATKHMKPNAVSTEGGRIEKEMPIHVSNVMLIDPKSKDTTRVGFEMKDGKKIRVSKKSGQEV